MIKGPVSTEYTIKFALGLTPQEFVSKEKQAFQIEVLLKTPI